MYDAVTVGGGLSGLSAALSLAHFRRSVLLLDAGEQRNLPSHAVHNYLGLDGISPRELLARGRAEARQAGAELREARVTHVRRDASGFAIELDGQPAVTARRIILATSLIDVQTEIENFAPFVVPSVFHCLLCDAMAFANRPIVVVSWGPKAAGYTL